ncbi:MAG: tetratricopeptide repeat protein [Caldisericia bacterium]|nr:tetratricopeptide repeat protein [Caldisericia bacterium]
MELDEFIQQARKNEQAGLLEEAILSYEKALTLDPKNKEAILGISRMFLLIGNSFRSLEILMQQDIEETDVDFLLQKANTYMTLNQFQDAEKELKKALKLKINAPALNNLGVVLIRLGKLEEALHYFSESIKLDDKNANTWFNLSTYYETQRNMEKATDTIRQGLQKVSVPELMERLIQLLSKQGKHNEAILKAEEALLQYPENNMINMAYLRALFHASEWALFLNAAKEFKKKKIVEAMLDKEISELEEKAHFQLKEFPASLEMLDKLIAQNPNQPGYIIRKAYILAVTRNFSSALSLLKQLLSNPNLPQGIRSEAFILMKNIEIENWKSLISVLYLEPSYLETLSLNPENVLESRKILLPDEGISFLKQLFKKKSNPFNGIDFSDGTIN